MERDGGDGGWGSEVNFQFHSKSGYKKQLGCCWLSFLSCVQNAGRDIKQSHGCHAKGSCCWGGVKLLYLSWIRGCWKPGGEDGAKPSRLWHICPLTAGTDQPCSLWGFRPSIGLWWIGNRLLPRNHENHARASLTDSQILIYDEEGRWIGKQVNMTTTLVTSCCRLISTQSPWNWHLHWHNTSSMVQIGQH